MLRYSLPGQTPPLPEYPRSVALGIFDGLHSGHQSVITAALVAGGGQCAVYTFAPGTVTTKGQNDRLCTDDEQSTLLSRLGVTELFEADFAAVRHLTPIQFVEEVLVNALHAGAVACGYNYRFGQGGQGDAALLQELCASRGIAVTVLPPVEIDGEAVNSTAIRRAIAAGDMTRTRRLLGRGYCLRLPVSHGQQLGRRLGMPTINQVLPTDFALPPYGVYASSVEIGNEVYPGVTNIGLRPTVGAPTPLAETWIHGFSGDLYEQTVAVYPLQFLRPEEKFPSVEALRAQVYKDGKAAAALFAEKPGVRAVFFDFDDTLGLRSPAFAAALEHMLQELYPSLEEATLKARHREMSLFNHYGYGMPCSYPEFFGQFMAKWPPELTISPEEATRRFYMAFATAYSLCADVRPGLRALREQGFLLGTITNGTSYLQNAKLTLSGARPLLDIALVCGDEGIQKPAPGIFARAAARLGLSPAQCLYVGDNPTNDIGGALGAGMQAVWIDRGLEPDNPSYSRPIPPGVSTVHSLTELVEWIGKQ